MLCDKVSINYSQFYIERNRDEVKEEDGQNGKIIFSYNFGHKWYFSEIFGIQLSVDMCCALKSLKVRIS